MNLLDLVDALTLPVKARVKQQLAPNRSQTTTVELPPLLVQLEQAIRSSDGGTVKGAGDPARVPLNSDALHRFNIITGTVDEWLFRAGLDRNQPPVTGLRAWYVWTLTHPVDNDWYGDVLHEWGTMIRGLLNPRRVLELLDDCPSCGSGEWTDNNGDTMLHPLVLSYVPAELIDVAQVPPSAKVSCRSCGGEWRGSSDVRYVAWELEQANAKEAADA